MKLTYFQKREIFTEGFVKVPGVVPRFMVDEASGPCRWPDGSFADLWAD